MAVKPKLGYEKAVWNNNETVGPKAYYVESIWWCHVSNAYMLYQ